MKTSLKIGVSIYNALVAGFGLVFFATSFGALKPLPNWTWWLLICGVGSLLTLLDRGSAQEEIDKKTKEVARLEKTCNDLRAEQARCDKRTREQFSFQYSRLQQLIYAVACAVRVLHEGRSSRRPMKISELGALRKQLVRDVLLASVTWGTVDNKRLATLGIDPDALRDVLEEEREQSKNTCGETLEQFHSRYHGAFVNIIVK